MRKLCLSLLVTSYLLWAGQLCGQERKGDWVWGGKMDPLQEKFEVLHYELDLKVLLETEELEGFVKVRFLPKEKLDTLRLNLIDLYSVSLVMNGNTPLSYIHKGDTLDILMTTVDTSEVTIYYKGITPVAIKAPWKGGFVWSKDNDQNHWVGLACQGEGAKIFMPCLDHPSSEALNGVDLKISVPAPYFVAGNGRLHTVDKSGDGLKYHWRTDYPINNYLINFTIGRFHMEERLFNSVTGRQIPMAVYVLEEHRDKAISLLNILERSAHTQEKFFGPYPFPDDKIAVVETPYLGMEHQTINAYGNNFKYSKVGDIEHDWLLHHELGHEWWGNMVTVDDWAHFWIHEGTCTYGDWLFYLEHAGEEAYQKHVSKYAGSIMNIQPIVAKELANSDESYHLDVYYKGAFIMHSLRFLLGDEVFFPMLKAFLATDEFTYDHHTDTREFIQFVEDYSGRDLGGFFRMYLYTTDLPKVIVQRKQDRFEVHIPNIDFELPVEIKTSRGIERWELSSQTVVSIESDQPIIIDPNQWLLLDITEKSKGEN